MQVRLSKNMEVNSDDEDSAPSLVEIHYPPSSPLREEKSNVRIPVTVLVGFLGSGVTVLLKNYFIYSLLRILSQGRVPF